MYNPIEILKEEEFPQKMRELEEKLESIVRRGSMRAFDGCPIHYEQFPTEHPRGNVVMVHGFTEFSKKYYELCWYFLQQGYQVFLFDLRGHGLSGRQVKDDSLVHVNCYEDYVRDLEQYMEQIVCPAAQGLPIHLFGHSMGGAIVMLYLMAATRPVEKVLLSSPMVVPVTPLPPAYLRHYIRGVVRKSSWDSRFPHASSFKPDPPFATSSDLSESRFRRHIDLRRQDVRYQNSSATNAWMYHTLHMGKMLLVPQALQKIQNPILLIQAEKDRTVRNPPQNKLAKLLPHCRLEQIKGAKHSLYNGDEGILRRYLDLLLGFLEES